MKRIERVERIEGTTSGSKRLIPSTRFFLAILISFGFVVQYAQRINLSIAIVCMIDRTAWESLSEAKINTTVRTLDRSSLFFEEQRFRWNEFDQQIILGSYWAGYLLTLIPSGWLSITLGAKSMFTISIFVSSIATLALSGIYFFEHIAFVLVVVLRIVIGAAHGVVFPVTYTLWAHWAVSSERATLSSIGFCGTNLGTAFIVLVGGLLCRYVNSGWIHIFLLSGILGFLWLPLWIWQAADTPADHRSISSTERDYIQNIIGKSVQNKHRRPISLTALPWKDILRSKPVIALFVTELCCLFGFFFFLSNFGKLLTEIQRIPSQYTGYILACGFICMLISTILSGFVADKLVRRNLMTLTNVRKLFNSISLFIPALCMIAFYFSDENHKLLGILAVIVFLFSLGAAYGSGYMVNFSDVVPAYSGLMFGIVTTISSMAAIMGNLIAGSVIKHPTLHDWRPLFILFFVAYLIGGIVYAAWASAIPEKWATLQSLEQGRQEPHSKEETAPMKEQPTIDETDEIKYIDA